MTLAVTRTKAEQAITQSFDAVAAQLPGGGAVAEARKAAIGVFAAQGLPHRRIEEWKYTDLRSALKEALPPAVGAAQKVNAADVDSALESLAGLDAHRIVFVDGVHSAALSTPGAIAGVSVGALANALAQGIDAGVLRRTAPGHEAVIALNTAFMTDGAVIRVAGGAALARPLLVVFARAGKEQRLVTTRNLIEVGPGARAVIIEAHVTLRGAAAGQVNALSEVVVEDRARLDHLACTLAGEGGTHLGTWIAGLGARSVYRAFQLTADTALARNTLFATFKGEGAKLDISGSFLGRGSEHIDTTLVVDHALPACESRELFKGVLAGRARSIFQGKVIVRPDAQKTDGKQMAQALMLSEDAEFDSKPELEIHADDVVCGHGSTSAEIDADMLFYLMSRGIPLPEARALLVESFVGEAIDKIEDEAVREAVAALAGPRLAKLTG